jgi:hypothetical protein
MHRLRRRRRVGKTRLSAMLGATLALPALGGLTAMSKRENAARVLSATGLGRLLAWMGSWDGLLVFNYHRIGRPDGGDGDDALFSATPEAFDAQVRSLAASCDVIGPGRRSHRAAARTVCANHLR